MYGPIYTTLSFNKKCWRRLTPLQRGWIWEDDISFWGKQCFGTSLESITTALLINIKRFGFQCFSRFWQRLLSALHDEWAFHIRPLEGCAHGFPLLIGSFKVSIHEQIFLIIIFWSKSTWRCVLKLQEGRPLSLSWFRPVQTVSSFNDLFYVNMLLPFLPMTNTHRVSTWSNFLVHILV